MSIITFIFIGILSILVIPSVLIFIFCFILGVLQHFFETICSRFRIKNKPNNHFSAVIKNEKKLRSEAGRIILNRLERDDKTTFH